MATLLLFAGRAIAAPDTEVTSPDGSIQFNLNLKNLGYDVLFKTNAVIKPSWMMFSVDKKEGQTSRRLRSSPQP